MEAWTTLACCSGGTVSHVEEIIHLCPREKRKEKKIQKE
jgi:hypothetical protein